MLRLEIPSLILLFNGLSGSDNLFTRQALAVQEFPTEACFKNCVLDLDCLGIATNDTSTCIIISDSMTLAQNTNFELTRNADLSAMDISACTVYNAADTSTTVQTTTTATRLPWDPVFNISSKYYYISSPTCAYISVENIFAKLDCGGYIFIGTQTAADRTITWSDGTPYNYTNWSGGSPSYVNGYGDPEDCGT
ncbi:unnamed protein product, partial [Mesorhabditis spiculigera]